MSDIDDLVSAGLTAYKAEDYKKAAELWGKAAEQGNAEAQYHLGECYEYGKGVEESMEEAVKWFRKAAEPGHAGAEYNLTFI